MTKLCTVISNNLIEIISNLFLTRTILINRQYHKSKTTTYPVLVWPGQFWVLRDIRLTHVFIIKTIVRYCWVIGSICTFLLLYRYWNGKDIIKIIDWTKNTGEPLSVVFLSTAFGIPDRHYRNFPKFQTDRSGQTVQTQIRLLLLGSTLFAMPSASFGCITLRKRHLVKILEWLQQNFWVSEYLGNLR